jgi:hypothetical protein
MGNELQKSVRRIYSKRRETNNRYNRIPKHQAHKSSFPWIWLTSWTKPKREWERQEVQLAQESPPVSNRVLSRELQLKVLLQANQRQIFHKLEMKSSPTLLNSLWVPILSRYHFSQES